MLIRRKKQNDSRKTPLKSVFDSTLVYRKRSVFFIADNGRIRISGLGNNEEDTYHIHLSGDELRLLQDALTHATTHSNSQVFANEIKLPNQ